MKSSDHNIFNVLIPQRQSFLMPSEYVLYFKIVLLHKSTLIPLILNVN